MTGGGEAAPAPPGRWRSVRIWPSANDEGRRDQIMAALFALGSTGVHEDGDVLATFFPPSAVSDDTLMRRVALVDAAARVELGFVDAGDWSRQWPTRVGVHALGPLTIAPPWLADGLDPACTIVIDPAMAFGTGEHETTRGVMRLLPHVVRAGDIVADLGSGSGVLAIAAVKLGAARVAAIEMDHDAIGNAEANVARNGVADRVRVIEGDAQLLLPLVAPVRLITANIISSVVVELLPSMMSALVAGGQAVLSGILCEEREAMVTVLGESGWHIEREDIEGEWWSTIVAP